MGIFEIDIEQWDSWAGHILDTDLDSNIGLGFLIFEKLEDFTQGFFSFTSPITLIYF